MRIRPRTKHQSAFGYSPKLAITIQFGLFSLETMKRKADSKEKPKLSFSILYLLMVMMPLHHHQREEGTEHNQWIWLTHIGKGIHFALLFAEKSLSLFLFIPYIFIWFPRCLRKKNTLNSLFSFYFYFYFSFRLFVLLFTVTESLVRQHSDSIWKVIYFYYENRSVMECYAHITKPSVKLLCTTAFRLHQYFQPHQFI